ncbi:MAG: transcriptional regulator [Gammaproteobacteria bacterium RIFCSPHIGHO2_12_FULL_43_28]|nr:MAG: transcriptional regulator [Gammaproteobacteria bacterium RIFCSPHIGHO2_12_FULL_43_28]HLB41320.1 helix-turn-helix domain-containing protein [Gammaproteobacteria bacterium]
MANTLRNRIKKLPIARRNKINKRAKELIAQELTLRDLRKALALTQADVSSKLHMKQEAISRLERRSDILLSTLVSYIKAMGGELNLTAKFPNRPAITLKGFEDIEQRK